MRGSGFGSRGLSKKSCAMCPVKRAFDQQLELARRQQLARIPRDFNVRSDMEKLRKALKSKPSKRPQGKDPM